jgi:hypothetical protein
VSVAFSIGDFLLYFRCDLVHMREYCCQWFPVCEIGPATEDDGLVFA